MPVHFARLKSARQISLAQPHSQAPRVPVSAAADSEDSDNLNTLRQRRGESGRAAGHRAGLGESYYSYWLIPAMLSTALSDTLRLQNPHRVRRSSCQSGSIPAPLRARPGRGAGPGRGRGVLVLRYGPGVDQQPPVLSGLRPGSSVRRLACHAGPARRRPRRGRASRESLAPGP